MARCSESPPSRAAHCAVDLHLDCDAQVPTQVATEAARAAGTLLRLAREPDGSVGWRSYHRTFVDGTAPAITVNASPLSNEAHLSRTSSGKVAVTRASNHCDGHPSAQRHERADSGSRRLVVRGGTGEVG